MFLAYSLLASALALFAAWLPYAVHVQTRLPILLLFAVTLAGLSRGSILGFTVSAVACCVYLWVGKYLGAAYLGDPVEVQLTFAVSAVLAVLSGGAHDDRLFEWRKANYDYLTGLPNCQLLEDRLEQVMYRAQRDKNMVGLLFIDLDRFKEVNDTYGHDIGDQLLIQVAVRLSSCLRATDTLSRKSGDEFVAVISDVNEISNITLVAEKFLQEICEPFKLSVYQAIVSASIGIAIFPNDGRDIETLRNQADLAMYKAKKAGRNRFVLYCDSNEAKFSGDEKFVLN